jgi:hypothetical protein
LGKSKGIVEPIEIVKEKGKYPYILYPLSVSRASPAKKLNILIQRE